MAVAAPPRPNRRAVTWLAESAANAAPLKVDRKAGVIFGVKVLGRYSPNCHGDTAVTEGTEYTVAAMQKALPLYEGATVKVDHPADRGRPTGDRPVEDTFGVLRNARVEGDCVRADLHYYRTHRLAETVCEDVERGMGQFGLSHNARGGGPVVNGRKLIEEITDVRSVDLVDRPATNRNLWESREPPVATITVKALLESQRKRFSAARQGWLTRLLEMDEISGAVGAEVEAPAESADPDEALSGGFKAACEAVLNGDGDVASKVKRLKELLTAEEKLLSKKEPEAPGDTKESDGDGETDDKGGDDDEKEKAVKESKELADLRRKDAARDLCESLQFVPTKDQLAALTEIASDAARKTAAEAFKAAAQPQRPGPRSRGLIESRGGDGASTTTDARGFTARLLG